MFSNHDPIVETKISIYPNPASDILKIEAINADHLNMQIISLNGQTVFNTEMNEPKTQIDISDLKAGLYLIRIDTETLTVTKKTIKTIILFY